MRYQRDSSDWLGAIATELRLIHSLVSVQLDAEPEDVRKIVSDAEAMSLVEEATARALDRLDRSPADLAIRARSRPGRERRGHLQSARFPGDADRDRVAGMVGADQRE